NTVTIRVAQGTYYPDLVGDSTTHSASVSAKFELHVDVAMEGGYRGGTLGNGDDRNPITFITYLNGDQGSSTKSYHVVKATESGITTSNCLLDGFVIENGDASGSSADENGGGIYVKDCSPKIRNCHVIDNAANTLGGGIYCENTSAGAVIRNCYIA